MKSIFLSALALVALTGSMALAGTVTGGSTVSKSPVIDLLVDPWASISFEPGNDGKTSFDLVVTNSPTARSARIERYYNAQMNFHGMYYFTWTPPANPPGTAVNWTYGYGDSRVGGPYGSGAGNSGRSIDRFFFMVQANNVPLTAPAGVYSGGRVTISIGGSVNQGAQVDGTTDFYFPPDMPLQNIP